MSDESEEFPKLFRDYYAIHETINALIKEGIDITALTVERRVKERHKIGLEPATLAAAIKAALDSTR